MNKQEASRFRLMEACLPSMQNGNYTVTAKQSVNIAGKNPAGDDFSDVLHFSVQGAHFCLPPEEVQAVYPPVDASGNYANSIGHITLKNKTLPWENNVHAANNTSEQVRPPWLALISVAGGEPATLTSLTVADLLQTQQRQPNIFYPLTTMPACTEQETDLCCVLDLSHELFEELLPRESELRYLAHVKSVDMFDKSDVLIAMNGFFSVVVSNRFIPSGGQELLKSTLHLVSLEGYAGLLPGGGDAKRLEGFDTIRLVSLYHWDVYSQRSGEEGFREIFKSIPSGPLACAGHPVLERGSIPLPHTARTGETIVSLYRGPLAPYRTGRFTSEAPYTADGRLIYDRKTGLLDLSYAAAWQLGRLLTLKNTAVAVELLRWRKACEQRLRSERQWRRLAGKLQSFAQAGDTVDFWADRLCHEMAENALIAPVSPDPKARSAGAPQEGATI